MLIDTDFAVAIAVAIAVNNDNNNNTNTNNNNNMFSFDTLINKRYYYLCTKLIYIIVCLVTDDTHNLSVDDQKDRCTCSFIKY